MSLYRPILATAWRTTIHERRLWPWALVAGIVIGSGIGSALAQLLAVDPTALLLSGPATAIRGPLAEIWVQARATGTGATVAVLAVGAFLLALLLASVAMVIMGVHALTVATAHIARGAPIPRNLRQGAAARGWPTFAIVLLAKLAATITLIAWGALLSVFAQSTTARATFGGIVGFLLAACSLTIIHCVTPYAIASAILDRRTPLAAIREAFALLRSHTLVTLECSALLSAAHVVGVLAWLGGSLLLALPFWFSIGIGISRGSITLLRWSLAVGIPVLIAYLVLVAMVTTTFLTTAWTLAFLRLTGPGGEPEPWLRRLGRS